MQDYAVPVNPRSGAEGLPANVPVGSVSSNYLTPSAIGSLPRALSPSEREVIAASTPLSPTLNLVSSLPGDRISQRSVQGRQLRRHVLRGAVLVFVTAGYRGKRFIFERAKELGVRSVILDGPDSWSQELVDEGVAERFVPLDMSDGETLFERALEAVKRVRAELGDLDGVVSFAEMAMPLVSRLADALGLPGNPASAVDDARDKHRTRARMAEAGLPTPRNFLITERDQLHEAAQHVGFPSVIKPIFGAASLGVVRVDDEAALVAAFDRVTKEMAAARIEAGALVAGGEEEEEQEGGAAVPAAPPTKGNAEGWIKMTIMMEEYLDGPEVDVDLVFSEGAPVYGAVTDNWPTIEPYFNETGSNAPSILPTEQQKELLDLAVDSVKCLGFAMGVFHVECKYTSRGARLIEVNCRMGGGPVRNMNLLVWGVDLVEEQLLLGAGIPSRPPVADAPLKHIAEYSINAKATGTVGPLAPLCAEIAARPGILYCRPTVSEGAKVVCVEDGMPTWIIELMVEAHDVHTAIDIVNKLEEEITSKVVITPTPKKK